MTMRSAATFDELQAHVLKEWEEAGGTPEELGAAIYDATMTLPMRGTPSEDKLRKELGTARAIATARIRSFERGAELIAASCYLLYGRSYP
jgi:hypothetical protein